MSEYHALASPSKAEMWLACPNSLAACEGQPEGDKKAADLGTDKHSLLTDCLTFNEAAITYLDRVMPLGNKVDRDFADAVQTVVDNIRARIKDYERLGRVVTMEIEQDVPIDHITGEKDATGRADIVLIVERDGGVDVDVIDAKFGYQEVLAEDNPQLMLYAAGVLEKFGLIYDFVKVTLVIEQPARGASIEWETTADHIREWAQRVVRPSGERALTIHRMRGERALKTEDFNPTEKGCMWCRAKAVCPALKASVEEAVGESFETIEEVPDATLIEVEALAPLFEKLELIEDWIKAVRARIDLELLSGKKLPGLKVVAGKKGNRTWSSDEEAEAMMKKFRLKVEQMYAFKLLGPKPILDLLKDQPRRMKQIESLVVQPPGKPHVALESDKRPALEIEPVVDGFETIDDNSDLC